MTQNIGSLFLHKWGAHDKNSPDLSKGLACLYGLSVFVFLLMAMSLGAKGVYEEGNGVERRHFEGASSARAPTNQDTN